MRLLGLEITEREVRVARAERSFGKLRLGELERVPLDDPAALPGRLADLARTRPDAVFTALPPDAAAHRIVVLPFRDRRRLAATAPLELLGQLPVDPEGLAVACVPLGAVSGGTAVLAAAARRSELDAHAALLTAAGLVPARIELAPLPAWNLLHAVGDDVGLVIVDGPRSALAVRRGGRLAAMRPLGAPPTDTNALAAEVRWSFAALGGMPPIVVVAGADADSSLEVALAGATGARVVGIAAAAHASVSHAADRLAACAVAAGLVAGAGRGAPVGLALRIVAPTERGSVRRIAALGLVAALLATVDLGLTRHGLARRDAALTRAIAAEAAAALPGVRLVAPREQLAAAAATAARREMRLGGERSVLDLLRELSGRVPAAVRLDLDEVTVEPDTVLLHGRCDGFDAVDALRRALAASPALADVSADETRTTVDGRHVEFRVRAARRPAGGASS